MDTPTRRFSDPEDDAAEAHTPRWVGEHEPSREPRRCLRCDYLLTSGMLQTSASPGKMIQSTYAPRQQLVISVWAGKTWTGAPRFNEAICDVLVCTRCGYAELAVNPHQ